MVIGVRERVRVVMVTNHGDGKQQWKVESLTKALVHVHVK